MAVPALNAEEYQYLDAGVKLNGDSALPFVDINSIDGLDAPPVRLSTSTREGYHGTVNDAEFEDGRTITIEGSAFASPTALETYLDQLKANFAPTKVPQPFYFGTDAGVRMVLAKSLGLRYAKEQRRRVGIVDFQVQLPSDDPRIYTPAVVTQNLPGTLTLGGNRETTGTITINGSRTDPTITIGGKTIAYSGTIVGGSSVVIDLDNHTVILDGTQNVRGNVTITGGWPVLQPGDNVFTVGGSGTGTIQVAARSAWR